MTSTLFPPVKWAQRADSLFVTLDLPDVDKKQSVITLGPKELNFTGKSNGKDYQVKLEFLHEIDHESAETKWQVKPRQVSFFIKKKTEEWWDRLLENKQIQKSKVKVDFDKWKDEDESAEDFNLGNDFEGMGGGMPGGMGGGGMPGGFDMEALMRQMGGAGGMGGMGGGMPPGMGDDDDGEDDEDDSGPPPLEESS